MQANIHVWVLLFMAGIMGCQPATNLPDHPGRALAEARCAGCHAFSEPALLPKTVWQPVLLDMGGRMGMYDQMPRDSLLVRLDTLHVLPETVYPLTPQLPIEEWNQIWDYYMSAAPDSLVNTREREEATEELDAFRLREPRSRFDPPLTTLTHVEAGNRIFFVGNYGQPSTLVVFRASGEILFDWTLTGDPVDVYWENGRLYILLVGLGPEPNDAINGAVMMIDGPRAPILPVVTSLKRPVDMKVADLNGDGREDILICEFGNETGFLTLYEQNADGKYSRNILAEQPGAVESFLHDFNEDGLMDIGVLFAQGDERFDIFYNEGGGAFRREMVLRFPPVYGSTHISLADMNGDGIKDLVHVAGDNADATPILKPYHGIRIYLGDGQGQFQEEQFIPLHGASKAAAADFDGDGDMDLASIAFFPDYRNAPHESFVLFENTGRLQFEASTFTQSYRGRWLTMSVADIDQDSDMDILLGSNIGFEPQGDPGGLFDRWQEEAPSFLLLENQRVLSDSVRAGG